MELLTHLFRLSQPKLLLKYFLLKLTSPLSVHVSEMDVSTDELDF